VRRKAGRASSGALDRRLSVKQEKTPYIYERAALFGRINAMKLKRVRFNLQKNKYTLIAVF
jgi:hypothetical protein